MKLLRRSSSRKSKRPGSSKDEKTTLSLPPLSSVASNNAQELTQTANSDGNMPFPVSLKAGESISRPASSASATKPLPVLPPSNGHPAVPVKASPSIRKIAVSMTAADSSLSLSKSHPPSAPYSQAASNSSENWTGPEDADGAYIRRTYAHFDASGIKGDGHVDGKEWTRERGSRSAWDPSDSAVPPFRSTRLSTKSSRREHTAPSPIGENCLLTASPRMKDLPSSPASMEMLESPTDDRRVTSPTRSLGEGLYGVSSSSLGAQSVESVKSTAARIGPITDSAIDLERQELMKNIDRYGFFFKDSQSSQSSHSRITVLPASSLQSIPRRRGGRQGLKLRREGTPKGHLGKRVPPSDLASDHDITWSGKDSSSNEKTLQFVLKNRNNKETAVREREAIRVAKWDRMLEVRTINQGSSCYRLLPNIVKSKKFRKRVYKGIPDRWRSAAWWAILLEQAKSSAFFSDAEQNYKRLLDVPSTHDVQIDLDVPRTISGHVLFRTRYGQGQRSLFHVLHAFSLYCSECAYCQGMGPIVATLLVYFTPERSYAIMLELHRRSFYGLHEVFSPGFPGLVEDFYVQKKLCESLCPELNASLEEEGVEISSYATKWYITLYTNVLPFSTQLRLWDCYLLQGKDLLVVIAVAILWSLREDLMEGGFETAMKSLTREFIPIDDDTFLNWIFQVMERDDNRKVMRKARLDYRRLVKEGKEPML
ncbi:hypothetical protein CBS101457_002032 [Exobasidium rhododendri]|nr:hypothetical protein CBS101457_002032 [Exobasidium rhododendri]